MIEQDVKQKEVVKEKINKEVREEYTYDEAFEACKQYFDGDELAAGVWINKYALKDSQGRIYERTPEDMRRRLAFELARVESKYQITPLCMQIICKTKKGLKAKKP